MLRLLLPLALSALSHLAGTNAECRAVESLPVMYDDNHFMCAIRYDGLGNDNPIEGCKECDGSDSAGLPLRDGYDLTTAGNGYYGAGSIQVKHGCRLYAYLGGDFTGEIVEYDGPATVSNVHTGINNGNGCGDGYYGFKCRCTQKPISCVPQDGFEFIISCDNTEGDEDVTCIYSKTIGTSYTEDISNSMEIHETISEEMTAQFFHAFEETIGFSVETGYNWEQVTSETKSEEHTLSVEAVAPPGSILFIEQAIGYCDGSTAKTEMFRITNTHKSGKKTVTYEHGF